MIYAIQAGDGGPVKFGVAKSVGGRLRALQTGCPTDLRLLAFADVGNENESLIHYHLRNSRIRGEWFSPDERAMAMIDAIRRQSVSVEHVITNHIYDNDFDAIIWIRRRIGLTPIFAGETEPKVANILPKANGETPLDQPVIPVAVKAVGVDRSERRPFDRTAYQREYVKKWRLAKKKAML